MLGKLRIIQQAITKRLSRVADEVPACLKEEIIIAFRSGVLQKRRCIDKALP
jgi:hypothetical protein